MANLIINAVREEYGIDSIRNTMTVGELIRFLEDYDEDTKVFLSFDRGYTYGGITEDKFEEEYEDDIEDDYYE